MVATVADFDDETAWERTVLAYAVPLMPLAASGADLDLRTKSVNIGISEFVGENAVEELRNSLLPLLFGGAWKVLDLCLELALAMAGLVPKDGKRWSIEEKSTHATAHNGRLPGFSTSSDVWRALGLLYAGTKEIRHALVHRRVQVDPNSRDLIGFDRQGTKLLPLSYDEQMAFCRLAQRLAQAVSQGSVPPRVEADLRGQVAVLKRHHGVTMGGTAAVRPPVRIIDDLPATRQLDVPHLIFLATTTFPGAQYVDLELHLDDGRILAGELESAPQVTVTVDPASPPSWLQFS